MIHSCAGDDNWPERDTAVFSCPQGLEENSNYKWEERMILELPEEMKKARGINNLKYQALLKHETALEPDAYEFLMAFIKDEENFLEGALRRVQYKEK